MRSAICILLSFMLLFTLSTVEAPDLSTVEAPDLSTVEAPDAPHLSAWWGLLFPQMFAQPDGTERVIFTWPLMTRLIRLLG